jgi:hypothetical protein
MVKQLLILTLVIIAAANPVHAAKRIALIIANSDYSDLPKIEKAENDARLLRETLSADLGFDVKYVENASRREMSRRFDDLQNQVGRDDVVLIYYAGHGLSLSGDTYMLPVDIEQPQEGDEQFIVADSAGLLAQTAKLRAKGSKAIFVFFDANRDNPFNVKSIGAPQGLERLEIPDAMFVMYSTGYRRASYESLTGSDANPNSVFVRSLVPVLKQRGLDQAEIAKRVGANVSAAAADAGLDQKPVVEDKLRQRIILNSDEDGVFAEEQAAAKPDASSSQAQVLEEWKIVKASGNRAALEGFKEKYGSDPVWGPLVDDALEKAVRDRPKQRDLGEENSPSDEDTPLFRDLQKELRRVGCYSGPIDGIWGDASRRALGRAALRSGEALSANEDALDILSTEERGLCSITRPTNAEEESRVEVRRKPKPTKRKPARVLSSVQCWTCHTYDYTTTRACFPRRFGNPEQRIAPYIRCRPAGSRSVRITSP